MSSRVAVQSFVLCEEIRKEASGSAIIIGASQRGPEVPADGKVLPRLSFYIEAVLTAIEKIFIRMQSEDREIWSHAIPVNYRADFEAEFGEEFVFSSASVNAQLIINGVDVEIPGPGKYTIEISADNESWDKVREYDFPPPAAGEG